VRKIPYLIFAVGPASERRRAGATAVSDCAVLDGGSREEAAKIGGMDHETPRDWVIRFNE
jgi:transposase